MPKKKKTVQPKPLKPLPTDPKGWLSVSDECRIRSLAPTIGVPSSHIHTVLEDQSDRYTYIFSYKDPARPDPEVFYHFHLCSADTYRIESPRTRKELWDVLQYEDWFDRIVLKDVLDWLIEEPPSRSYLYYSN